MITLLNPHLAICPGDDEKGPNPKIVLLMGQEASLLIDVSNDPKQLEECLEYLKNNGKAPLKYVVLTHFHDDHIANLPLLSGEEKILCSKNTSRYLKRECTIIKEDQDLDLGGYQLRLILVPSLHAQGCLDVLVDSYLFVGDSLYSRESGDGFYYNPQIAYEMRKKYESIPFVTAIEAHDTPNQTREEVLAYLKKLALEGIQK
jgi:glyoxylase-like metal-dependent hydrolase (beta-lactamase superfamily II)